MFLGFQYPSDEISIPEESFKFQVKLRSVKLWQFLFLKWFEMQMICSETNWMDLDGWFHTDNLLP